MVAWESAETMITLLIGTPAHVRFSAFELSSAREGRQRWSAQDHAAVDVDDLAVDPLAVVGHEEGDHRGDVVRAPEARAAKRCLHAVERGLVAVREPALRRD